VTLAQRIDAYLAVHFFLYPAGHTGFTAVIFFMSLPLRQVISFNIIVLAGVG
jgi:hypothetical protein